MNILITSAGIRGYLVRYFREALKNKGKVFAADCDRNAPALYQADVAYVVHPVSDDNYIKSIIRVCRENDVKVVLSLNDTELPILARDRVKFEKDGVLCVVSAPEVIDTCQDKFRMHAFLIDSGFSSPRTFIDVGQARTAINREEISFPLIIKPRRGSASIGIGIVDSWRELELVTEKKKEAFIIQEFLRGNEYGLDIYVDLLTSEVVSVFPKRKIRMRAGETDKAVSVMNEELIALGARLARKLGAVGPIDVDCFEKGGKYLVTDINPRFGGGYPLAHACGIDFTEMVINNASGHKNNNQMGNFVEGRYMFKYPAICIRDEVEISAIVSRM